MARMNNRFDKPEDRLKRVKNWKREKGIKAGLKDKRRVWLPASPALRQIRYYQATTDLLIPQAPFQRIVRDIIQEQHGATLRMQTDALGALQVATEQYLVDLFTGAMRLSIHAKHVALQQRDIQRFCAILRMYNVPSSTQVTADISEKKTESDGPMLEEERRLEAESAVITEEAVAKKANSARAQVSSKRPRKTVRGKTPQKTYTGSKEQPQDQNSHDEHRNSHDHEEESQLDEAEDRDDNQSKTTGHSDDESSDDEEPPRDSDNDEDLSDDEISSQPEDSDDE